MSDGYFSRVAAARRRVGWTAKHVAAAREQGWALHVTNTKEATFFIGPSHIEQKLKSRADAVAFVQAHKHEPHCALALSIHIRSKLC